MYIVFIRFPVSYADSPYFRMDSGDTLVDYKPTFSETHETQDILTIGKDPPNRVKGEQATDSEPSGTSNAMCHSLILTGLTPSATQSALVASRFAMIRSNGPLHQRP